MRISSSPSSFYHPHAEKMKAQMHIYDLWMNVPSLPARGELSHQSPLHQPHFSALTDGTDRANCYADEPLSYLRKCSGEISGDKPHFRDGFIHSLG